MRDMQPQAGKAAAGPEAQRGMTRLRPDERTMGIPRRIRAVCMLL